ncbi:RluA family pseudouridine synthase [Ideonella paludis]|uniref:Pseudouridine synthase n=1 Tax=Ideonella paludis TaxID=1233411 RepID=A0ABS5DUV6_9BURK|nr:RluA family pseudouridine synthase [Ideonella paludis]MBQ0934923.1 RluA family pseudouridine synthase [Ideonella paludis]
MGAPPGLVSSFTPDDTEGLDAPERRILSVGLEEHGLRLDKLLTQLAPEFSRSHLQHLIQAGHVQVNEVVQQQTSRKLKAGQRVQVDLVQPAESQAFTPQAMDLNVVYEDEHLLVVNKPAGLVVHPAAGNWSGTLLNGLLARDPGAARLPRAGIVHRLDKDTSGLMVVARSLEAMTALVRALAARDVHRQYMALVQGDVGAQPFTVEAPIGRDPQVRVRMAVVPSGKEARTDVRPLAYRDGVSAIWCKLHTGRTHQIRVHLQHRGHPLVADAVYGGLPALGMRRQALHAAELAFVHPLSAESLSFTTPAPQDLAQAWASVVPD